MWLVESEGLHFKVIGSHIHRKSGNILEMVLDGDVTTGSDMWPI